MGRKSCSTTSSTKACRPPASVKRSISSSAPGPWVSSALVPRKQELLDFAVGRSVEQTSRRRLADVEQHRRDLHSAALADARHSHVRYRAHRVQRAFAGVDLCLGEKKAEVLAEARAIHLSPLELR